MADTKISNLNALAAAPSSGDFFALVDTSASETKKIDAKYLARASDGQGPNVTGGGTVALAGFTLTVPATGTAALLATANVFTAAQTVQGDLALLNFNQNTTANTDNTTAITGRQYNDASNRILTFATQGTATENQILFGFGVAGFKSPTVIRFGVAAAVDTDSAGVTNIARIRSTGMAIGPGATNPATSAVLDLQGATGALLVSRLTTTQRNALTPTNGMIVYNSTDGKFQGYEAGAWANLI